MPTIYCLTLATLITEKERVHILWLHELINLIITTAIRESIVGYP